MADKSSQLLLSALSRAAAEPNGLPLHGGKTVPGLFPTTPAGKQAALRCVHEGYLRLNQPAGAAGHGRDARVTEDSPAPARLRAKTPAEWYVITDKGLSFLLQEANPRQVLEDLVRVLEARQVQTGELLQLAGQMRADILQLTTTADRVLQQVPRTESLTASLHMQAAVNGNRLPREPAPGRHTENGRRSSSAEQVASLHRAILSHLDRWQVSGASQDYPLGELFRHVQAGVPGLTIGRFHDALRDLQDAERIYLHPWTGPLYDLPEPAFALLVGHLIAYYASGRPQPEMSADESGTATVLRFPAH